ncbi:MAG: carboxy-S-adenosyl-L-methionine synthase CmoA [Cyclobacteriaceae bacterium]|jgi:tRNA (cmo5U34)-methyltransferase|nr:carboxy-S-adenosyl-L-methionine synthase CmoA [Cyclobacteriaceae bacterium]
MQHDEVFKEPKKKVEDFSFNKTVVKVFDNMVTRSVPFYLEMQRMMTEIAQDFATPGSTVYDLGCSTGTTLINLHQVVPPDVKFVGYDNSDEMVAQCIENFKASNVDREYEIRNHDLNTGVKIENASVVVLCLTLQFIRPLYRDKLVQDIYNQMNPNSCLILIEKVLGEDSLFNRLFIKYYYDFKRRNNYNDMEIAQKREALENVLIPYKLMENREMLLGKGFRYCEVFFKWYNFAGLVAVK